MSDFEDKEELSGAPSPASLHSFTYFVRHGEFVKIGATSNPDKRLKDIQSGFPRALIVLAIVSSSVITEFDAHLKFAHLRVGGEWFRAEPELLNFAASIKPVIDPLEAPRLIRSLRSMRAKLKGRAYDIVSNIIERTKAQLYGYGNPATFEADIRRQYKYLEAALGRPSKLQ